MITKYVSVPDFSADKSSVINYVIAFLFILLMAGAAVIFEDNEIILPEIAAMAVALWVYKSPEWVAQADKIFIVPSVTAIAGFGINMLSISYTAKIGLVLLVMALMMSAMKFVFPPALATGFLPVVTNAHEWSFIISVVVTTALLMAGVKLRRIDKSSGRKPEFNRTALWVYVLVTLIWIGLTMILNISQFAVIPPLTVVLYESLKMKQYSVHMVIRQLIVLNLSVSVSVLLWLFISNLLLLSLIFIILMYFLQAIFSVKIPAVYAFPFLVFVFPAESVIYLPAGSLTVSAFSLGAAFLIKRKLTI